MSVIEGNKDEAYRCIDIAITSLAEGKLEKAEKFLLKAEKLYPTQKAKGVTCVKFCIIPKHPYNFFSFCFTRCASTSKKCT